MAKKPKLTDWSKGTPLMIGEYNASVVRDTNVFRWWDGKCWSKDYRASNSDLCKQRKRRMPAPTWIAPEIEWRGLVDKPVYPFPPGPLEPM